MDRHSLVSCVKYFLMIFNVFGFILAIFNALFGIGYPDERWPGGYTGGQMAIVSVFVMMFTTVGYCGVHHRKSYLLLIYGFIILIFTVGNVVHWVVYNDNPVISSMANGYVIFLVICDLLLLLFTFCLTCAYWGSKKRKAERKAAATAAALSVARTGGGLTSVVVRSGTPSNGPGLHYPNSPCNEMTPMACPVPGCTFGKNL